uniref:HMA domain-containing protein n=1 Tax=Kalanchoe fedtschenkoi TaxID=63787 RepID=A0A7N0UJ12_KALFE
MAKVLDRTISSFVSSLTYYLFRFQDDQHMKGSRKVKYSLPKGRPLSLQTIELKVRMCCEGCERVVKRAIFKLRGISVSYKTVFEITEKNIISQLETI